MERVDVHVQACLLRWSNSLRFGHGTALPISDTRSVGLIEKWEGSGKENSPGPRWSATRFFDVPPDLEPETG